MLIDIKMLKNNKLISWQVSQSVKQLFLLSVCLFVWKDEPSLIIQTFLRSQACPFPKNPVFQAQR